MEPSALGAFIGDEWDALCKLFTSEDADLLHQLNGDDLPSDQSNGTWCFPNPSIFFPMHESDQNVGTGTHDGITPQCFDVLQYLNFHNVSPDNSNVSESNSQSPNKNLNLDFFQTHDSSKLLEDPNHGGVDDKNGNVTAAFLDGGMEDMQISPREEVSSCKFGSADVQPSSIADSGNKHLLRRKRDSPEVRAEANDECVDDSPENQTKKPRVSKNAQKSKREVQSKRKKSMTKVKEVSNVDEEEGNGVQNGDISSYCSSEDNSNASQESNGDATSNSKEPALNLNGKTRASRGSATDPQSLYARRRRERINERLRTLQNLIPNGTKVDISTMLEEAVHYVKFLQLQIKLLSSDDTWMYAPIVYNGIDVGMYNQIFPTP